MTHCLRYESASPLRSANAHATLQLIARIVIPAQLTLDGRIILVDEVALDQLYSQARLSHATASYHYELILSKKLRHGSAFWGVSPGAAGVATDL